MEEPLAIARDLCRQANLAEPSSIERLPGGRNNRVYHLFSGRPGAVLKLYFRHPNDDRNRLASEWSYLTYSWSRGVRLIPQPLAQNPTHHAALYSHIPGRMPEAADITLERVAEAAAFVCAANAAPRDIAHLPLGSEACLSIAQHLAAIDKRVARLETIAPDAPHRDQAERLVRQSLAPLWRSLRERILASAAHSGLDVDAVLNPDEIIASPSDFGFHNTILGEDGRLRFIDFEYAGRDDPAKLAGDFYAVPAIPAPPETFEAFVEALRRGLGLSNDFVLRARLLRDAYLIKWTCIILNDLLPAEDARRSFATAEDRAQRCALQLRRAEQKLAEIAA